MEWIAHSMPVQRESPRSAVNTRAGQEAELATSLTNPSTYFLFADMPPMLRRRGSTVIGLILGPRSSVRKFTDRVRCGVEDIAACFSESRPIDLLRDDELDAALLALDAGDRRAARAHIVNAKALDARIDPLVWGTGWPIAKRINGCLERALKARRPRRSAARAQKGGKL